MMKEMNVLIILETVNKKYFMVFCSYSQDTLITIFPSKIFPELFFLCCKPKYFFSIFNYHYSQIYPTSHDIHNRYGSIKYNITLENHSPFLHYTIKVLSGSLLEQKIPKDIQSLHREIKRLRREGLTYNQITIYLNDNGWTTSQGKKFYSSYVHNIEKRIDKKKSIG